MKKKKTDYEIALKIINDFIKQTDECKDSEFNCYMFETDPEQEEIQISMLVYYTMLSEDLKALVKRIKKKVEES